jgi:hypothetical protein
VSRTGLKDAFRMLVEKAGLTPDVAVEFLYGHVSRSDGKLDELWCNGTRLKRSYIRECLSFKLDDNDEIVVVAQMGVGGGRGRADLFLYKLDADQFAALIATLTKSKREPGRHEHAMKDDILAEYDRRCEAGEPHEAADLLQWAATELKNLPKYANTGLPHRDTIGRWVREERPPT